MPDDYQIQAAFVDRLRDFLGMGPLYAGERKLEPVGVRAFGELGLLALEMMDDAWLVGREAGL